MSKPLTIEELKALKVGDWVWVVPLGNDFKPYYAQIRKYTDRPLDKELWLWSLTNIAGLYYINYGITWLAYKNKEQAEGKDEQVRKEVAKEILTKLLQWKSSVIFDTESIITAEKSFEKSIKALAIEEYGVEVDK